MTTLTRETLLAYLKRPCTDAIRVPVLYHEEQELLRLALEALAVRESGIVEALEMLGNHRPGCECDCMDYRGISNEAIAKYDELKHEY